MAWNKPGDSGNRDPWSSPKGGNQGPPDLDEIVRNIQNRLSGLFKGGRGGGAGGTRLGGFRTGGYGAGLIIAAVLAVWLLSGFYVVQQPEQAVVLRFGKAQDITAAGLHWHLPYPIERVEKVNVRNVFVIDVGYRSSERAARVTHVPKEALMLTQDENIVDIEFAIQYRISDPAAYLFNIKDQEVTIAEVTESAMREVVGKSTLDHVITEGRVDVANRTQELLQEILDRYKSGIAVTTAKMQKAQPPEQVKTAFDDAVKAREDEQRFKNEAQAYANDVIPRARGAAARIVQQGEGYKASVIARAEGDAQRFLKIAREFEKAPEVTRERLYLETMEEVLSNTSKVFVDQRSGTNVLYLPLDKIISRGGRALAPEIGAPGTGGQDEGLANESLGRGRNRGELRSRGTP